MKFGKLYYNCPDMNLGDIIQAEGLNTIYKRMGISEDELVYIDRDELSEYQGEYVILPITGAFGYFPGTKKHMFPLSSKIIPVFLGVSCIDEKNLEEYTAYKNFGPIGCRDLPTLNMCRKYGLEAYAFGCMSLCIEPRNKQVTNGKVLLNDVPKQVVDMMPQHLKDKTEYVSQFIKVPDEEVYHNPKKTAELFKKGALELLKKYREEAELVITSKMHCALPCLAMGIPVIFTKDSLDYRFAGFEKILNPYTIDNYSEINWNPEPYNVDKVREMQISVAIKALTSAYEKYKAISELSDYFEDCSRKKAIYYDGWQTGYLTRVQKKEYLDGKIKKDLLSYITGKNHKNCTLVVWGCGDKGRCMNNRYDQAFKLFREVYFVDSNPEKENTMFGAPFNYHRVVSPQIIKEIPREELVVIVAANSYLTGAGREISEVLINEYGLCEGKDFYMLDRLNNSANYALDDIGMPINYSDGF